MTRAEAKDYLANYRRMYADLAPEKMLDALDLILAEQPEVDIEKEVDSFYRHERCVGDLDYDDFRAIAEHFYELGQKDAANKFDEIEYNRQRAESRIMTREMIEGRLLQNDTESWNEDYNEEDLQTRFAFYTYKDEPGVLYLSNLFVEEASRKQGLGTKILEAAERVAETIGAITIGLKVKQGSPANAWYRKNGYGYVASEYGYDWLEKKLNSM